MRFVSYFILLSLNFYTIFANTCLRNQHVSGGACVTCTFPNTRPAGDDPTGGDTACTPVTVSALPDCGITAPSLGGTTTVTLTQDCKSGEINIQNSGTLIINGGGYSIVASGTNHRFIDAYTDIDSGEEVHIKLNNVNIDGFNDDGDNYGGAFKTTHTWLEAKSCSFTRNRAGWRGGVIRAEGNTLTYFEDCEFAGNRLGANTGITARGGLVSAALSTDRLIIRSSKVADTKREGTAAQNDFIDCKGSNHCVLDEFTADVAFAEQNVDLKTNMACPASGTNFDVNADFAADVGTDYNYCKSGETCATGVVDYTIVCSGSSSATLCAENEYVASNVCTSCPPGTTNAAGDDASGADTSCDATLCAENEYVASNVCTSCPPGTTKAAGDDASGADTSCDATLCAENLRVVSNDCVSCPPGTTNAAGDDASGADTYCDLDTPCGQNHFVNTSYQCEACSAGTYNDLGDVSVGTCDDTEKCLSDQHVKQSYVSDNTKKYGSTSCTGTSDCETKCTADSGCAGYTNAGASTSTWGSSTYGNLNAPSGTGYIDIFANEYAFAALKTDTSIKVWGDTNNGGSSAPSGTGFTKIFSSGKAFAALKDDGSIKAWGVSGEISGAPTDSGYVDIVSHYRGFAALKSDGSITSWGTDSSGGPATTTTGFTKIVTYPYNGKTFGALNSDGSVVSWGYSVFGGTGEPTGTDFTDIVANGRAIAALKSDGSIIAWGESANGGTSPSGTGFTKIAGAMFAFAALKSDGSITAWGDSTMGGSGAPSGTGFTDIIATMQAFTALKSDGSVISWGSSTYGATGYPTDTGYVSVYSNYYAFAALKSDGSVTAWGQSHLGGSGEPTDSGYVDIVGTKYGGQAFAALKNDGSIFAWGDSTMGGTGEPTGTGFTKIVATRQAFAALGSASMAYGPLISGTGNSFTKNKGCDQCPAGYNNAPMDDPLGAETTCDFISCGVNERVSGGVCTACTAGATRAAGDSDPLVDTYCTCGVNQHVASNVCTACPLTSTRAAGDDASGANTYCTCGANEYVSNKVCTTCPLGTTRPAGDDSSGDDTTCIIAGCPKDYRVKDNACIPCPDGMTNEAGDTNVNGDTYCDSTTVCNENEYVSNHVCTTCPLGTLAPYGSDPAGADTTCTCGKDQYSDGTNCQTCTYGTFNNAGDPINVASTCDDDDVCEANEYVSLRFVLHEDKQISNAGGYSDAITDFAKAKRLCIADTNCKGLTKDASNNYYLSDGTLSANTAYDAYEINRTKFMCHTCPSGGTRAAGDVATAETQCTFDNCAVNHYVDDYECKACPTGKESAATNPSVGNSVCTTPPCAVNEHVTGSECAACPAGSTNAAGDNPDDGATECDWGTCGANEYVSSHVCTSCANGTFNDAGDSQAADTTCDDLEICDANEYGAGNPLVCTTCPGAGTNAAARVNETGTCTFPDCQTDQYSDGDGLCKACPSGRTMPTAVNPGVASKCLCAENERVLGGVCTTCPAGFTNAAGDDPCGICDDTQCDFTPCAINQYVVGTGDSRVCTDCTPGTYSPGGDATACSSVEYCSIDQKVVLTYASDNTKKYGSTACTSTSDCETKCTADSGCAGYTDNGISTVKAWGNSNNGGTDPGVINDIVDIFANDYAFAALKTDGSITVWGSSVYGGTDPSISSGVANIYSTFYAFAALKTDGSITVWGSSTQGGGTDAPTGTGYTQIYSTSSAFAAMKADGSITVWGDSTRGGCDSSHTPANTDYTCMPSGLTNVVKVFSTSHAFAAIKADGSVVSWGMSSLGGTGAPTDTGYVQIYSNGVAFAALKSDGSIKAWGSSTFGGTDAPTDTGYTQIFANARAFAAMKADGSITAWGSADWGGLGEPTDTGYTQIFSTNTAFAAIKADGSITVWGNSGAGGGTDAPSGTGYTQIFSNKYAFAALKDDGSITAWGHSTLGGGTDAPTGTGYTQIYSTGGAFAALKNDGSVTVWGSSTDGGTDPSISSGVANIYSTQAAFVAVGPESLAYGSVVTGTGNSFTKGGACTDCPEGFQNQYRNATLKDGPVNTCTVRTCLVNEYSDGSTCQPCAQYTGAASAGIDPTAGPTACTAITCKADERVVDNVCTACDSTSYRAPGDQIFGGDTHCFCKDNHKVINKACVACEEGSSNPNLCYSGLQDHYCICDANYHVVNKVCTACPAGATRPAGDYGGNGDTHCICGEDQHVVNNVCTPCTGGAKRPAGDDSSGVDTVCSCVDNEHVKNISNVLQCSTCPTGSVRAAGDFPAGGVTSCACPEDFHVSGGICVACVAGTRAAGDDPSAGDTHCACNENHRVVSNVCTSCPEGQERAAGDDASGADTSCLCKENFFSNGDGTCSSCDTANGAVLAAGSDPAVASQCQCGAGYETSGASCSQCAATEESVAGEACKCKENHYYDGSACTACVAGSTHPAGDDKTATTSCTIVTCAENEHVVNHVCVPCVSGMVRAAGDEATGDVTECAYQGTSHVVSTSGNFVYKIDGGSNNGELTVRVGETHSFYRDSAGNPFRIVTEADCDGKDCDKAQYNALPESSLGVEDAEQNVAVTVFAPAEAGLYYYMSTTNGYRKGRITAKWPLCVITYPVTTLTGSCELNSEVALTGDLTITYSLARLRAQSGDVPQIVAASSSRHFSVSGGHKLSIENLDLSGGRSAEGGSILVDQGEIDINNVKFTDNIATGAGGAIRVKNALSKVNMNNILFDGNQGSEGGAISILDAMAEKVEIHNSDFKNNLAASGDGGAIKADSVLNITLTNFEDNNANSGEGGGISSTKDVTLTGSSFRRNKALRGGALKSKDNHVDMSNMVIEANEAIEEGGAFNVENAELDVQSSTISANKAKKGAAVKSSSSGCTTDCKKVRIRSSSISDNEASSEGGAIDFGGDTDAEPQFWVQDTSMTNNKAAGIVNNFKQRSSNVKIKAIDSDVGAVDGGAVDNTCATDQCSGRAHSTCEVTSSGTTCACDGANRHLSGTECKVHKVCTGLGLDVQIRAPDKTHDRLCGTEEIADLTYKLDDKGKELANMIEAKLVSEGVAADEAYALAVEVFGEINKCE